MIGLETLSTLEFKAILEEIACFSHCDVTREMVLGIRPFSSRQEALERFGLLGEIRRLYQDGKDLGLSSFKDIRDLLRDVRPEGSVADPLDLLRLLPALVAMHNVADQIDDEKAPLLREFASGLSGFPALVDSIEMTVDEEGGILDSASPELSEIRRKKRSLERKVNRRLEEIVRDKDITSFLQDDFVTTRSGRWVIPVRMDSKGLVQGVVHDVSRSGETAFVEPLEIIGLANELENLVADEKTEEIRILKAISRSVRASADEILTQFETLTGIDLLNSIALFSESIGLEVPELNEGQFIKIKGARHPLLMLYAKKAPSSGNREIVPLDLTLGGEDRVMVITGPNAGGKTIAIKTVGITVLMALSGIPVPMRGSSSLPFLDGLLVDIGDEQSIQEGRSTFSAHVSNISSMLGDAGPGSLVLVDELGTGTDPEQGGAIGCAVLKDFIQKGACVLATTHLVEIVVFANKEDAMTNASMEFDQGTMTPLYRLKQGEPGQSYALETARKFGLPESTVNYAKDLLGTLKSEFHGLMADLKDERARYEKALAELEAQRAEVDKKARRTEERLKSIEKEKKEIMRSAYEEAQGVITRAKREAHEAIEKLKNEKRRRAALKQLDEAGREIKGKLMKYDTAVSLDIKDIKAGDRVFVKSAGLDATVARVEEGRGRVIVNLGRKEINVSSEEISAAKETAPAPEGRGYLPETPQREVPLELNLLGLRADEAMARLERYLNDAALSGAVEVKIVHGIGTGALLKAVREHLEGHPLVSSFRRGEQQEGGEGVTVARLA